MAEFVNMLNYSIEFNDDNIKFTFDTIGNPWFYTRDVLKILKYKSTTDVIENNIYEENKRHIIKINEDYTKIFGYDMHPHTIFVDVFGLYKLISESEMKKAKYFRKLVTTEILPLIRQYGHYEMIFKEKQELRKSNEKLCNKIKYLKKKIRILGDDMSE
jgi:prophage antirepressor-like protein